MIKTNKGSKMSLKITLGSLFDGSGGFPLAGVLNGIEPVWASEIEPYPLKVTAARFPCMKQLGDVTKIDGAGIEAVDVITFGSPCQDLSVAGKQTGIHEGKRSSLFFEAVRIINEMRGITNGKYPRFAVWENVPGAFSSNKGEDFRAVLQALCEIAEPGAFVPEPPKGKWAKAGCIVGDGYSIAWRVYDAQYWGVPQRRKRIYLVADFGSERAGEILFECEGVCGDSAQGREAREGTTDDATGSAGRRDRVKCLNPWDCQSKRQYTINGAYTTLDAGNAQGGQAHGICYALDAMSSNSMKSNNPHSGFHEENVAKTLQAIGVDPTCNQGGNVIVEQVGAFIGGQGIKAGSIGYSEQVSPTLKSVLSGGNAVPDVVYQNTCVGWWNEGYVAETLRTPYSKDSTNTNIAIYDCRGDGNGRTVPNLTGDHENRVTDYTAICLYGNGIDRADTARCNGCGWRLGEAYTLNTIDRHAVCVGNGQMHQTELGEKTGALNCLHDQQAVIHSAKPPRRYIVRRLTPLECCRLQGFPDWWEDGANGSDSARYKMWGNGIALPCAVDVLRRLVKELTNEEFH